MSNIFGPAGPFMHPDQIFCYSLLQALNNNNTLEWLQLPSDGYTDGYTEDVRKRIISLEEVINKNRESRGCQTKLIIY